MRYHQQVEAAQTGGDPIANSTLNPQPELILLLWVAGAALVAASAVAYVELGTAIPHAGGPYAFVRRAYGSLAGVSPAGPRGWC